MLGSLITATALCLAMQGVRVAYAGNLVHTHLAWNLFLAWLPTWAALLA